MDKERRGRKEQESERDKDDANVIKEKIASFYNFLTKIGFAKQALLIKRITKIGYL